MPLNPLAALEAALPGIIAESPSYVTRRREYTSDTFNGVTDAYVSGPHTVRIEPYASHNHAEVWDEKGNSARVLFAMVGVNLPPTVNQAGRLVPLFALNDTLTDQYGNTYRVASPQLIKGATVQVTLELTG